MSGVQLREMYEARSSMLLRMYTLCVSISYFRLPSIRITRPVISLPGSQYRSGNYRQRV